jgi:hypothetical protein
MLYVVCYMLYVICNVLYVICNMLYVICNMLYVICNMLYGICNMLYVICNMKPHETLKYKKKLRSQHFCKFREVEPTSNTGNTDSTWIRQL